MKASIHLPDILSTLDWAVFIGVLILTFLSVLYGHQKKAKQQTESESVLDLLLMGRQLTLPLFVATLVATWYGGIFGVTRIAFEKGLYNFVTQGLFWYISYLLFALFLVKRIAPYKAVTLPDLIGKMFGPNSARLSAVFNFFNVLPIAYTISLGLFTQMLFGGNLFLNMLLGLILVMLYSSWGGLRAVVYSDLIQFFVMCSSVLFVFVFSLMQFGGIDYLTMNLPAAHFELTGGEGWLATFVWGFIALATLVDPNFYQRCFAADQERTARRGIYLSTIVWLCFDICTTAGAMYARAAIPEAESAQAYLIYALQLLPNGLRGFFLAGILATILSTLDSYLFLAGTTLSYDLVPKKWRGNIRVHHLGILLVGILSLFFAYVFEANIKTVWKVLGSYFAACLLLPVLTGHLKPGFLRDRDFVTGSLTGVVAVSLWPFLKPENGLWALDTLYIGALSTLLGLLTSRFILFRTRLA